MQFYEHRLDVAARREALLQEAQVIRLLKEHRRGSELKARTRWRIPFRIWELVRG